MSHYSEVKTCIKDEESLVQALIKMGFKASQIDRLEQAEQLRGFQGDHRAQRAHIRIKGSGWGGANHVGGASNDLGWEKQADGTYAMHVSNYDKRRYGKEWQNKMQTFYEQDVVVKKARQCGYHVVSNEVQADGQIRITVNAF